jgi:hypothetical protein
LGALKVSTTAFLGPSWKAVDRSVSSLLYPTPSMIVVEIISPQHGVVTAAAAWKLIADPGIVCIPQLRVF